MILSFVGIVLNFLGFYQNVDDLLGVKGPLSFNKTEFHLALSGHPEKGMSLHTYLPKGEDLDNYNQKISLIVLYTKKDINGVIKSKLKDLATRQKTDFNCTYSTHDILEGKETIVEYVQTEGKDKKLSEAELNISRLKWLSDSDDGNFILIYTYSWRTYDDEAVDMIKNIKTYKSDFVQELSKKEMPSVRISK